MEKYKQVYKCPVCGSDKRQKFVTIGQILPEVEESYPATYYQCDSCRLMYLGTQYRNPEAFYAEEYRKVCPTDPEADELRAKWQIDMMKKLGIMPKRLLDVGSSYGWICRLAKAEFGCETYGVEPNLEVEPDWRDLNDVPFEFADTIMCSHVLEHQNEPLRFLSQIWHALKPDGIALIEVPNRVANSGAFRLWHPLAFEDITLRNTIEQIKGLKVEKIIYNGAPLSFYLLAIVRRDN